jgi:hypothetical protein
VRLIFFKPTTRTTVLRKVDGLRSKSTMPASVTKLRVILKSNQSMDDYPSVMLQGLLL